MRKIFVFVLTFLISSCGLAHALELVRQKNVATKIVFPIVDADGDTVTGAAGLDSEESHWSDGSTPTTFADLTNEATEIGTTGIYYLSLTSGETNQDYVAIQVKTSTSGAKTQHILIRTIAGDPKAAATVTTAGNSIDVASTGEVGLDFSNVKNATGATTLTNITIPMVTDVTNAVGVKTGTGANQLDVTSGRIKSDTVYWNGSAVATPDTAGYPKVTHKTGTGTGEISLSSGAVTVGTNNDKTGYTASTVSDKTGYSLTQTFPTNFSSLSIDASGRVDLGKWIGTAPNALISGRVDSNAQVVGDKTGYSLTQTFPTNFSSLLIDASGRVTPTPVESMIVHNGTAQTGAAGTITLASGASSTDDLYKGLIVKIYGGTGAGQSRTITGYTGSTKVATVAWNWTTNPDSSSTYALIASGNPSINSSLQVSTTASDPWATALPGSYGAGTAGNILGNRLDAAVSSRLASSSVPTNFSLMSIDSNGRVDISKWLGSAVNSLISGRIDSNAQVVGDKTGYSLTQAFPTNFSTLSIDGSGRIDLGKWIGTAPNALISGRVDSNAQIVGDKSGYSLTQSFPTNFSLLAITAGGAVTVGTNNDKTGYALTSAGEDTIVDKVWDELRSGHTTSGTFGQGVASVQGNVTGSVASVTGSVTVGTNNDKTGYRLSATGVDDIWDEVQSGHTTVGTFGKYLDAQVSSISGGSCPTSLEIADQVWDEAASDHLTAGSTGNKLNSAASAGDPWAATLPGSYGSGSAGKMISDINNATNGVKEGSSYTGIENMIRSQR